MVTNGAVGRGEKFYPHFVVVFDDGSRQSGPFHIFKPRLSFQQASPDIVEFHNSRFTRNPNVKDAIVTCTWSYAGVQGTSTVAVTGQPASLEISDEQVGRNGHIIPRVKIRFTDGSESAGFYHLYHKSVKLTGLSSDAIFRHRLPRLDRTPETSDDTVTCNWEYTEGEVTVQTTSTVKVTGQPGAMKVSDGEVGPGGVFYPVFNISFTDGSIVSGAHHVVGGDKLVLVSANPDIVIFKNNGFRVKPKAPTAKVECTWIYTEGEVTIGTHSTVEAKGWPESHLCVSDPQNVTPDSVIEHGDALLHSYSDRPTPVMTEDDELTFTASQPAGRPLNVSVYDLGRNSGEEILHEGRKLKYELEAGVPKEIAVPLFKGRINFIRFEVDRADPVIAPPKFLFVTQMSSDQQHPVVARQRQPRQQQQEITDDEMRRAAARYIPEAKKYSKYLADYLDDWTLDDRENNETDRRTGRIYISRPQIRASLEAIRRAEGADKARLEAEFKWRMIDVWLHEAGHSRAVKKNYYRFTLAAEEDRNCTELINRLITLLENLNKILCNQERGDTDSAEIERDLDWADASSLYDDVLKMVHNEKLYRWGYVWNARNETRQSQQRFDRAGQQLAGKINQLLQRNISNEEKIRQARQMIEEFYRANREDLQVLEEASGIKRYIWFDETCMQLKYDKLDSGKFGNRRIPVKGDCK
jgi:hypothetical protein